VQGWLFLKVRMSLPLPHTIHWLQFGGQRLGLMPTLGGSVAAWQRNMPQGAHALWRPWDGRSHDLYTMASFPLVPWSNRISKGGFTHDGKRHDIAPNRIGERYPIHGDGWLQPWALRQPQANTMEMVLESNCFADDPYHYRALQRFVLRDDGMDQLLEVTHLGALPLPYGLGQHPAFLRTPQARLHAQVEGVWLSGADPIPTRHTTDFPPTWDPREGMEVHGSLIDNAYTGWNGSAHIDWPEHALRLHMRVPELEARGANDGFCLLYRPPQGQHFCFEPVTHPIDAFHSPERTGLQVLQTGQTLRLQVEWRFEALP
jgi:aldose 1-epimerase